MPELGRPLSLPAVANKLVACALALSHTVAFVAAQLEFLRWTGCPYLFGSGRLGLPLENLTRPSECCKPANTLSHGEVIVERVRAEARITHLQLAATGLLICWYWD